MILKREGVGEFRELTAQEVQDLFMKTIQKDPTKMKRPIEFMLMGKRGRINGRMQQTYPTTKSISHRFTTRENGTTVEYAYCHRVENVRNGAVVEQKLMSHNGEPWAQKLGIQFKRTKKKIVCKPEEQDKALYLLLYPESDVSPFRGSNPHTYEVIQREKRAKADLTTAKERVALQNQILNEMDEATLRAYVAATGNNEVHLMEDDELRTIVLNDAMKDPDKFKARINSSSMNLRADVNSFINAGLLNKQTLGRELFWRVNFGEEKPLLCKVQAGHTDETKPLIAYFFDNPKEFEAVKYEYLKRTSGTQEKQPVRTVSTLGESEVLSRVEKYAEDGLVMYVAPHRKVVLADPTTGKKREGSADLCKVQKDQDWKEALALAIEDDPALEGGIPME